MNHGHPRGDLVQRVRTLALGSAVAATISSSNLQSAEPGQYNSVDHQINSVLYNHMASKATSPWASLFANSISDFEMMEAQAALIRERTPQINQNPQQNVSLPTQPLAPAPLGKTSFSYAFVDRTGDIFEGSALRGVGKEFDLDKVPQVCFSTDGDYWSDVVLKFSIKDSTGKIVCQSEQEAPKVYGRVPIFSIPSQKLIELGLKGKYRVAISGSKLLDGGYRREIVEDVFDINFVRSGSSQSIGTPMNRSLSLGRTPFSYAFDTFTFDRQNSSLKPGKMQEGFSLGQNQKIVFGTILPQAGSYDLSLRLMNDKTGAIVYEQKNIGTTNHTVGRFFAIVQMKQLHDKAEHGYHTIHWIADGREFDSYSIRLNP